MSKKWLSTAALAAGLVAIPSVASADTQWHFFGGFSDVDDFEEGGLDGYYYAYSVDGVDTESGWVVGAGLGVNVGNWTAEVEVAHREWGIDDENVTVGWQYAGYDYSYTGPLDGDFTSNSLMANAWYNIPTGNNFGIYVGGGIGIADIRADTHMEWLSYYYSELPDIHSTHFAWQLGAGVQMKTDSGFSYGIGYRYFNVDNVGDLGVDVNAHEVVFEFRF